MRRGLRAASCSRIFRDVSRLARILALSAVASTIGACSVLTDLDGLAGAPRDTDAGKAPESGSPGADGGGDGAATDNASTASAIAFVTAASAAASAAASVTVTLSVAPQQGDLLLAIVYDAKGEATPPSVITAPSGWAKENLDGYWATFYAFATASSPTTYSFALSAAASGRPNATAAIAVYRGVDPIDPFDVRHSNRCPGDGTSTDATCTAPSIATTRPTTTLVLLTGLDGSNATPSWTAPPGMSARADLGSVAIDDRPFPSVGPTGSLVARHAITGWSAYMNLIALTPAQ